MNAPTAFALAAAAHAGFQLTITMLVYPALSEVPEAGWTRAHDRHSRRIVPIVALLYAALLGSGGALVASGPSGWGWCGLAATAGALVVTATLAAPTHARLQVATPELLRHLLRVDRLRCALAIAGAVAGVLQLVT